MSDTITTLLVQIKGDATGIVSELKNFATGLTTTGTQVKVLENNLKTASAETVSFRENLRAFREPLDSAVIGLSLFGDKIPGITEALFGMQAGAMGVHSIMKVFGLELVEIAPYIGVVVAALAGGMFAWHEWNAAEDDSIKKAKDLAEAWRELPGIIKDITDQQNAGLLGPGAANEYLNIALGNKKLYLDANGKVTKQATRQEQEYVEDSTGDPFLGVPSLGHYQTVTKNNAVAPQDQANKWLNDQMSAGGTITKEYLDAVIKLREEVQKVNEESLSGIEKQKAEIQDRYQKERDEMEQNLELMRAHLSDVDFNNSAPAKAGRQALAQSFLDEQKEISDAESKAAAETAKAQQETLDRLKRNRDEQLRQIYEAAAKQAEADKQHEADLQRQAQLKQDIQRSDLENQIESVKANALMPDQQKLEIISALVERQKQLNTADIEQLENLKAQAKSLSDQLELEKKIAALKHQNQNLSDQPTAAHQNSFSFQFGKAFTDQQNKWTGWASESAKSFQSAWDGSTNAVSGGLTRLFEYGAQKGQWFREIWNGVIGSMISSGTKLAVEYVANYLVMGNAAQAFTTTSTAAHVEGETTKTAATASQSILRQGISLAETAFAYTMATLKLAAHEAGEIAATVITAGQAIIRATYHAIVAAIAAMESEASVPFVGVVLGIAAGAAILAAAYGLMGGFEAGGYTGDGHPSQVAGIVHAGEYVIPANRVNSNTMSLLHAVRNGYQPRLPAAYSAGNNQSASSSGGSPAHQTNVHNAVYFDKQKMVNDLAQSDAHEKFIVDVMARNIHKFQ